MHAQTHRSLSLAHRPETATLAVRGAASMAASACLEIGHHDDQARGFRKTVPRGALVWRSFVLNGQRRAPKCRVAAVVGQRGWRWCCVLSAFFFNHSPWPQARCIQIHKDAASRKHTHTHVDDARRNIVGHRTRHAVYITDYRKQGLLITTATHRYCMSCQ